MAHAARTRSTALPPWAIPGGLVVLVYLLTVALLPDGGFWINDNGAKFIQVQGIIQNHYRDYSIPWPGVSLDPTFRYGPIPSPIGEVRDGKLYVTYAEPFALLSSFPYRALGFRGLKLWPLASGLLLLAGVWVLAGLVPGSPRAQPIALLVAGLATPVWFYSATFWEHMPAACLGVWSAVLLVRHLLGGRGRLLVWSAVLAGLAVYVRADMILFAVALVAGALVWGERRLTRTGLFVLAFVLALVPLLAFQWWAVGHPLGLHLEAHSPFAGGPAAYLRERWTVFQQLLLNAHGNPWLSAVAAAPFLLLFALYPQVAAGALGGAAPLAAAFGVVAGLVVAAGFLRAESPVRWLVGANGLFAVSPILILAFLRTPREEAGAGPASARVSEFLRWTALLYALLTVALSPTTSMGVHWGCRFLLPVYALLAVMTGGTLARYWEAARPRRWPGAALVALALAVSLAAQVYSVKLLRARESFSARLNRAVAERPEEIVVANGWFLPQDLAPNFYRKTIFLVRGASGGEDLAERLRRAGVERVLFVSWPRADRPRSTETVTLDDGLKFVSVDLDVITLR